MIVDRERERGRKKLKCGKQEIGQGEELKCFEVGSRIFKFFNFYCVVCLLYGLYKFSGVFCAFSIVW